MQIGGRTRRRGSFVRPVTQGDTMLIDAPVSISARVLASAILVWMKILEIGYI